MISRLPTRGGPDHPAEPRINAIDTYRGIAIVGVIAYHYLTAWHTELGVPSIPMLLVGSLGVQLFFVVSGLVIAMTVLRSKSALDFLVKRFARLYPAYIFASTVIFLALSACDPLSLSRTSTDYFATLTFFPVEAGRRYIDGAFWSLNIEVKFYLLAALGFLLLGQYFWIGICLFFVAGLAARSFTETGQALIFLSPFIPFFLMGLALWYTKFNPNRAAALICGLCSIVGYCANHTRYEFAEIPVWAGHLVIVLAVGSFSAVVVAGRIQSENVLSRLGKASYSIYLLHQYLGVSLMAWLLASGTNLMVSAGIAAATFISLGYIMYRFIEIPGQRSILNFYRGIRK